MIDIKATLALKEHVNLEVKSAGNGLPSSMWETYSAFANTSGGIILLGVEENPYSHELIPKGVNNPHKMISDIWNTLNNAQKVSSNILLEKNIYPVLIDGKTIIVIEVPKAERQDKPIYVGSDIFRGTYRRNNEGDYHCPRETVLSMIRDQSRETVDGKVLNAINLDALNNDSIRRYRIRFNNCKPAHVWSSLDDDEFLIKIGAAKIADDGKVHPTMAGLVFFGNFINIIDEVPDFFLDYRQADYDHTRWADRICSSDGSWSGNIFDFYFKIINYLTADVKKPFALDSNSIRIDDTPIHSAIREALANALIHADYYGRCGIVVEKNLTEIKISNPGNFRMSIDAAIAGGLSDARNSRIFNMFSLIDVGERSGLGLCNLFSIWKENGLPQPNILQSMDPDRTTIILKMVDNIQHDEDPVRNSEGNVCNVEGNVRNIDVLRENERRVLSAIKANPTATAKEIAAEYNISDKTVNRICKSLREKGFIKREGSTRGKWIILK